MSDLIVGLYEDWLWLDERIETITKEIEEISQREGNCIRLMSVPGVGPLISTAVVAAIGTGEAFDRSRDFGAWLGLVPRQYSTGGRSILGGISKRGGRYLRTLFIQAAKVLLMRAQNWPKFRLRTMACQRGAEDASQQAGHRARQQARSHRLERAQHRQGVRHPQGRARGGVALDLQTWFSTEGAWNGSINAP